VGITRGAGDHRHPIHDDIPDVALPGWCRRARRRLDIVSDTTTGTAIGMPRPRHDTMPIPWITVLWEGVPQWRRFDSLRVWYCQAAWACQVCGCWLGLWAAAVVNDEGWVLSDAAMHPACVSVARRRCQYLSETDDPITVHRVSFEDIHADGRPLPSWQRYGSQCRNWTVHT
jgi:hypothetical protein